MVVSAVDDGHAHVIAIERARGVQTAETTPDDHDVRYVRHCGGAYTGWLVLAPDLVAEILDRLADVIRKRFELLSHARVLSAQQRYAAIFVGLSPLMFSIIFYFLSPDYFDPLIASPAAPMLIGTGLALEVVGFLIIWRLARIKV